ncbi:hypothetical protein [Calothrix sp. 336/3]|uniref:hypothetical protein n=1 Tax=Calothrix sp. 336/3 TaxID=1337936 RepID=UPI000A8587B5|nr:hypothetical protein [Calothrix sp. 336/3]
MKILYKQILNLELWHDYYLGQSDPPALATDYAISEILTLVPTAHCQQVLKNLRCIFRPQPWGATISACVEEVNLGDRGASPKENRNGNFQTQIPVDSPQRLTFWLIVRDRYFSNYTNLSLTAPRQQIYYFSNLSNNQSHALFLTQPLPVYAPNTSYPLGQLVTHDGKTLEALRNYTSVSDVPDTSDWDTFPSSQYVSDLDRLPHQVLFKTHVIPRADPGEIFRFTLTDASEQQTFALKVTAPDNHTPGEAIAVNLNFSGQVPGCYQLRLNNTPVDKFILYDPMTSSNAFALVEIVLNQNLVPPAFSPLQSQGGKTLIQPKTYVIRFKNRATHWRYRYEKPHGFSQDKLPDFELQDDKTYFTKRPQGLLRRPKGLLKDGKDQLLPAPGVMLIKPERQIDPETEKEAILPKGMTDAITRSAAPKAIAIFSDIYL